LQNARFRVFTLFPPEGMAKTPACRNRTTNRPKPTETRSSPQKRVFTPQTLMPDPVVIPFPDDLADWPESYSDFQVSQIEVASPEIGEVVNPSNPTIEPAVPVAFTTPGNQQPGTTARIIW
jgi:hypothetical protein